jgi:hypothetical protein
VMHVQFVDEPSFVVDKVRLLIRDGDYGRRSYLRSDGTWYHVAEGQGLGDLGEFGFLIPLEALPEIADAIAKRLGVMSDSATEAKVLREWLAREQRRYDDLMERLMAEELDK